MVRFVFIISVLSLFHPVHVSLLSLDYDREKGGISLFLKVYSDDLENDCRLLTGDPDLQLYDNELLPSKSVVQKYLDERIVIEAGDEVLRSGLVRVESDGEEVKIFAAYNYNGTAKSFRIKNTVMKGLYDDQANLMIFKSGNMEEGYKFTPELTEIIINAGESCY
ncbi:MAG: hypothetical protein IH591_17135 [Bacteroidales bacterium]|nr:hypothetical protein [Bacteroidales bacterium]